jgi:hypothetical protein
MKAVKDATLEVLEDTAAAGAKQLSAYFTYQGNNPDFLKKAKLGVAIISGYARVRATENGRMAVELAVGKAARRKR